MLAGRGDRIPVSMLPVDGTYPTATSRFEKRDIAREIPIWHSDICIQCGNCVFVCPTRRCGPSSTIRTGWRLPRGSPIGTRHRQGFPDSRYTLQLYPEDCTGCGQCVQACPVRAGADEEHEGERAIAMMDKAPHLAGQKQALRWFESLPWPARERVDFSTVRGTQFLEPCSSSPVPAPAVARPLSQAADPAVWRPHVGGQRHRLLLHLRRQPADYAVGQERRREGAGLVELLFEDNAEFGFGFRLTADQHHGQAVAAQAMKGSWAPSWSIP